VTQADPGDRRILAKPQKNKKKKAMSREDMSKKMVRIESSDQYSSLINESDGKLVIIDIHADWSGPCDAMYPTFNKLLLDYDYADSRLIIASASFNKVGLDFIKGTFPADVGGNLGGCIPTFALYRFKNCISVITGADAPSLLSTIAINIPSYTPPKEQ